MIGALGPVGKLIVAKKILENKKENQVTVNNTVVVAASQSIQSSSSSSSSGLTHRDPSSSSSSSSTQRERPMEKLQKITEQKEERGEKIEQLQTAATVSKFVGGASTTFGFVSFMAGWPGASLEVGVGAILLYAGIEGYQILENLNEILAHPLQYKEIPSGRWKVDEIGKQLKKDTYLSDWVIDKFIIPGKFGK